jgi:hypothetical protein
MAEALCAVRCTRTRCGRVSSHTDVPPFPTSLSQGAAARREDRVAAPVGLRARHWERAAGERIYDS